MAAYDFLLLAGGKQKYFKSQKCIQLQEYGLYDLRCCQLDGMTFKTLPLKYQIKIEEDHSS